MPLYISDVHWYVVCCVLCVVRCVAIYGEVRGCTVLVYLMMECFIILIIVIIIILPNLTFGLKILRPYQSPSLDLPS